MTRPTTTALVLAGAAATVGSWLPHHDATVAGPPPSPPPGSPTPGGPPPIPTQPSTSVVITTAPRPPGPLANTDPCSLLTPEAGAVVGITDLSTGTPMQTGSARDCEWRVDKESGANSYNVRVGIYDTIGVHEFDYQPGYTPITVAGRDAVETIGNFSCIVYFEVTDTSTVVTQIAGGEAVDNCHLARQLAEAVAPCLPGPSTSATGTSEPAITVPALPCPDLTAGTTTTATLRGGLVP